MRSKRTSQTSGTTPFKMALLGHVHITRSDRWWNHAAFSVRTSQSEEFVNRRHAAAVAASLAAVCAVAASPQSASAAPTAGTGSVTDTLVATVLPGGLTIAGAGASVAMNAVPGTFTTATGATLLTVSDTTGSSNGWTVTATYAAPNAAALLAGTIDLGGENVKVTTSDVVPDSFLTALLPASGLSPVTDAVLSSPVAVLTTGTSTGLGVSTAKVGYKVKVPTTATAGAVYGGTVTYTVASVR